MNEPAATTWWDRRLRDWGQAVDAWDQFVNEQYRSAGRERSGQQYRSAGGEERQNAVSSADSDRRLSV